MQTTRRLNHALSYFLVKEARRRTSYSYEMKSRVLTRYLVNELSPTQIARIFQWSPPYSKKKNFAIIKKQLADEIATSLVLYSRYKIDLDLGEESSTITCRWLSEIPSGEKRRTLSITIRPNGQPLIVNSWNSNPTWAIGRSLEPNLISTLQRWHHTDHSVELLKEATRLFFNHHNDMESIARLNRELDRYQLSLTIVNKTK